MSVLACDRRGCDNIMCDRLSHKYGYICGECFAQLSNCSGMSIEEFMDTDKDNYMVRSLSLVELEREFMDRSEYYENR